jgi:CubicO group peptidase (beta-lactamase class C family)
VLVAEKGVPLLRKGYGQANMEWHIPNTPDTRFRLGSVTKQFTATLVMQMVERGQMDLSAPISRYLPD